MERFTGAAIPNPFAAALWLHHQGEQLYSAVQAQIFQGFQPL